MYLKYKYIEGNVRRNGIINHIQEADDIKYMKTEAIGIVEISQKESTFKTSWIIIKVHGIVMNAETPGGGSENVQKSIKIYNYNYI